MPGPIIARRFEGTPNWQIWPFATAKWSLSKLIRLEIAHGSMTKIDVVSRSITAALRGTPR